MPTLRDTYRPPCDAGSLFFLGVMILSSPFFQAYHPLHPTSPHLKGAQRVAGWSRTSAVRRFPAPDLHHVLLLIRPLYPKHTTSNLAEFINLPSRAPNRTAVEPVGHLVRRRESTSFSRKEQGDHSLLDTYNSWQVQDGSVWTRRETCGISFIAENLRANWYIPARVKTHARHPNH